MFGVPALSRYTAAQDGEYIFFDILFFFGYY